MFRINQRLDPQQLHAAFRASGRLHIPDFLDEEGAERLATFLREAQTWQLVLNAGDKLFELDRAAQDKLTAAQRAELEQAAASSSRVALSGTLKATNLQTRQIGNSPLAHSMTPSLRGDGSFHLEWSCISRVNPGAAISTRSGTRFRLTKSSMLR